ncbi:MAG: hypothetical protein ACSHYF_02960 [Verrucomicrobiaceae bacterium]
MNSSAIAVLLGLNILVTGGLGALFIKQTSEAQAAAPSPSAIQAEMASIKEPLNQVSKDIARLNETVQRFSTSYVQYDFLKREMDRLAVVDQTIGVRAQATAATKTEKNAEEIDEVMGKLGALSQQVKGKLEVRRQTMMKLISGLEKELAEISAVPAAAPQPAAATGEVNGEASGEGSAGE